MLLTYSLTKAKRTPCDVAQFVADLLGCASRVHKILTSVMTVSLSIRILTTLYHIQFVLYHNIGVNKINICLDN